MWKCAKCGEQIEEHFDSCWKCATPKNGIPSEVSDSAAGEKSKPGWRLAYKYFRGTLASWDELFSEATQFATEIGPERVVNISHSADRGDGVVTVWYWTEADSSASSSTAES